MKLHFYAYDANFGKLGQLDAYTKIVLVPSYNAVRGWYIEMDAGNDQTVLMQSAKYISAVMAETGATIWTGAVRRMGYRSIDKTAIFQGLDALWLSGRLALPVPSGPPYTSAEYDVRTGLAETIIKQYVEYNTGASAKSERQIPGLSIEPDYSRGGTHTGRARFDKVSELVCTIALAQGLGVRVLDGQFQVFAPQDKSKPVRFSDLTDTLGEFEFEVGEPEANYLYGGGSGTGTSQALYEKGDSQSILEHGRIEQFVNFGRTAVVAEIDAQLDAELERQASTAWFEFDIVETPDRAFHTDFWLGDLVGVAVQGFNFTTRLAEVTITAYPDGTVALKPLFVDNGSFALSRNRHDRLRQMEQRIARLEES